jgi:uncharacterized protein (DUF1015 family)
MPEFIPFRALRPKPDYVSRVSAKSTDFNSQDLLVDALKNNPYSFHHVTKNHLNYSGAYQEPEKYLPFAAKFMKELLEKEIVFREEKLCYYLYEQMRADGVEFRGLVGLASVEDYRKNLIKKHEETRPSRVNFMVELFKTTGVLGEPTLIAYHSEKRPDLSTEDLLYEFESKDGKTHRISRISNSNQIEQLRSFFAQQSSFYIADGHHRSASTDRFNQSYPELDNNYFLCLLMEENDLEINSFHRVIRSIDKYPESELLDLLKKDFEITKLSEALIEPQEKGSFGLYTNPNWYELRYKGNSNEMDVAILEKFVVNEVYGISDSRTDSQISFVPNINSGAKLIKMVDSAAYDAAYTIKPCAFREIRAMADLHSTLPPKSTYIEPKLRAGMLIQKF